MREINERVKEIRLRHNLSMAKFADVIGVSAGNVGDWEGGKKKTTPSAAALIAISSSFDVSLDWLMTGKERFQARKDELTEDSSLFFNEKREVVSHYDKLIEQLDEKDRTFIDKYIEFALYQKQKNEAVMNTEKEMYYDMDKAKKPMMVAESISNYNESSAIPILGRAAAGTPIELVRFIEGYLKVPQKYKNCFAVKVDGESMVNAGIENGGYVVVRQQPSVDNNDIALVKVDDGVTIKRFKMHNDLAYLISENDNMNDMVYDPKEKDMQILGLIVDIISPHSATNLVIDEL